MKNKIEMYSELNPEKILSEVLKEEGNEIDFFTIEVLFSRRGRRFLCSIHSENNISSSFSEILGCWILDNYRIYFMRELLKSVYTECEEDFSRIINIALKSDSYINPKCMKKNIVKKITNHISEKNTINLEGFVRFRLEEYKEAIMHQLLDAAEELNSQKEYDEFIELLKLYVEDRASLIDFLHIKQNQKGEFEFYNLKKQKLDITIENHSVYNQIEIFLTGEDMLLNILVALSPRRIIFHRPGNTLNKNMITTIKKIFNNRFSVCDNCDLCND